MRCRNSSTRLPGFAATAATHPVGGCRRLGQDHRGRNSFKRTHPTWSRRTHSRLRGEEYAHAVSKRALGAFHDSARAARLRRHSAHPQPHSNKSQSALLLRQNDHFHRHAQAGAEYRTYLERSYWDIIVIDEAHNVAERGTNSMRSKLAKLLSSRSDTLIMLSATPHDGKPKSFASLMNMLNPTAIANPEDYGPEDIKGLFIRRFKKDIKDQVATSFQERTIRIAKPQATAAGKTPSSFSPASSSRVSTKGARRATCSRRRWRNHSFEPVRLSPDHS